MCAAVENCELYTLRTIPCLSMTYVTRPGSKPRVAGTPKSFCSSPLGSGMTEKGNLFSCLKAAVSRCAETAMISASSWAKSSAASRKEQL